MACYYTNKREFNMEYQVSTSMLSCISNRAYIVIRFIFAGWTWTVLGYSLFYDAYPLYDTVYNKSKCCLQYWPLEFTAWGLGFTSLYWLCILYLSLRPKSGCYRGIFLVMKVVFAIASVSNIIITLVYWSLVFDSSQIDADGGTVYMIGTINWHGVTAILITIEWFLNSLQLRLYMAIFLIIFGALYNGMLAIHYSQNWTDGTGINKYEYKIMDFHTDATQAVIYGTVLTLVSAVMFAIMVMIKRVMMNTYFYNESNECDHEEMDQGMNNV